MAGLSLFDLFREFKVYPIEDHRGTKVEVGVQSLTSEDNEELGKVLEAERAQLREFYAKTENRKPFDEGFGKMTQEGLIGVILGFEESTAKQTLDLAPNGDPHADDAKTREEVALQKWKDRRTEELKGMDVKTIAGMAVERQLNIIIQSQSIQKWLNAALVAMIVAPDELEPCATCGRPSLHERERMLALESKTAGGKPDPKYVGRLQPQTRNELIRVRNEFTQFLTEQRIRETATKPAFLSSGASPSPSENTPGETSETPSGSPASSPPSTPSANG